MTSKIIVNTVEADTGINSITFNDNIFVGDIDSTGTSTFNVVSGVSTIGVTTVHLTGINDLNYPTAGPLSNRNIIINGGATISQRGTTAFTIGSDDYPTDRFLFSNAGTTSGGGTGIQTATSPAGFTNAIRVDVTTQDTSLDASAQYKHEYRVEGLDSAHLNWGTADAQTVTLSFYVRSNKTGNTSVALVNSANDRSYVKTFTIDSADTWERKECTIPGDTSGTWLTNNNIGIRIRWGTFGSTFQTSSVNQWTAGQFMSRDDSPINFFDAVNNTFYLTGVQLETGSVATPFEHRSFGEELARCQRYYYKDTGTVEGGGLSVVTASLDSINGINVNFPVTMRSTPDLSLLGTTYRTGGTTDAQRVTTTGFIWGRKQTASGTANIGAYATGGFEVNAEL
jgi:hypothetical protein